MNNLLFKNLDGTYISVSKLGEICNSNENLSINILSQKPTCTEMLITNDYNISITVKVLRKEFFGV